MTLLKATGLGIEIAGSPVLHGVDFEISAGEIVTLVGPNGSGKSTLIRALLGMVKLAQGSVTQRPGLRIGYVPQRLAIDAAMPLTVARFLSLPKRQRKSDVDRALSSVSAHNLNNQQLTSLSGGEFQRVLLARALLGHPDILVLDEPTQGLDQPGIASFYRLIEQLSRKLGCAVLLASHDLHVVMSASDRVVCLNGHVCCEGSPKTVLAAPEYRKLFGDGTGGALALYRHEHDHDHHHSAASGPIDAG